MNNDIWREQIRKLSRQLVPEWLLECLMYDERHSAIVISPKRCLEHGVRVLQVCQDGFGSKTILHFRLDYNIKKVKRGEESP